MENRFFFIKKAVGKGESLSSLERQLCDIQGRLFELALKKGLNITDFAEKFMNSETAAYFDLPYDRLQWAGEEYILENLQDEVSIKSSEKPENIREEVYWTGYLYRFWHFYTGESSKEIYSQAPIELMISCYLGFHTMDPEMAVDDLKEIYRQKQNL